MKKNHRAAVLFLLIVVIAGAGTAAVLLCDRPVELTVGKTRYHLCGPDEQGPKVLELYGNMEIRQVSLAFEASGRIAAMNVEEGDWVQKGRAVASLDTRTLEIQAEQACARMEMQRQIVKKMEAGARPQEIAQAKFRLTAARADAAVAQKELARLDGIAGKTGGQAVSRQELDLAAGNDKAAKARVSELSKALELLAQGDRIEDREAQKAQLRALEADLALIRHKISLGLLKSPVDGVVRARLLEPGDMASPQAPVFTLALTDPKWVRVYASETDLGRIKPGMEARVFTDSHPDSPIRGQVGYISSVAEFTPKSVQTKELRTSLVYEVRVTVKDPDNRLRLGQPVTVTLLTTDGV